MGGSIKDLRGRTIDNLGTTTWTGTGDIRSGNGAVFNNLADAVFDVRNDEPFRGDLGGAASVFNNVGTFRKSVTTGVTSINLFFNNTGVVDVDSGILSYDSGGTSTGSFDVATGATLRFPSSTFTLNIGTTITGVGTTRIDGGTVTIGATATSTNAVTALNLDVVSGTLNGSGDLTMAAGGQLDWTGGTMNGGGKITIPETAELNISGTANKDLRNRTIDNLGTTTWTGTGNIRSGNGAVFNNLAGGVFDVQNDEFFSDNLGGAAPRFNNAGTFKKTVGTGTTNISLVFNNTGVVDVDSGLLSYNSGGTSTGNFDIATGATLQFPSSTFTLNAGTTITGAGTTQVNGGTVTLGGAVTALNLDLVGGTLNGTGDLTMAANGTLDWTGGTMTGGGKVTIPATAQLNISGTANKDLRNRTVDNLGTTTWTGTGNIRSGNGGVFNNLSGATFDAQNDRSFVYSLAGGATVFNNAGTFKKTVGVLTTSVSLFFVNTGTVEVDSGLLSYNSGGTSTGNFDIATGATMQFPSNTFTLNIGTTITGAGATRISGGTVTIGATATSTNAVTALNLDVVSGTLNGSGDLTMAASGTLDWTGGTLDGGGKITIPATAELNISGTANKDLRNRTIDNLGTTTWTGTGNIRSGNGGGVQQPVRGDVRRPERPELRLQPGRRRHGLQQRRYLQEDRGHRNDRHQPILQQHGRRGRRLGYPELRLRWHKHRQLRRRHRRHAAVPVQHVYAQHRHDNHRSRDHPHRRRDRYHRCDRHQHERRHRAEFGRSQWNSERLGGPDDGGRRPAGLDRRDDERWRQDHHP